MGHDSKFIEAILYGVVFVVGLKIFQFSVTKVAPFFAAENNLIVAGLAAVFGSLVAWGVVGKIFPMLFPSDGSKR